MADMGVGQTSDAEPARTPERRDEHTAQAWARAVAQAQSTQAQATQTQATQAAAPANGAAPPAPAAPVSNPNANMHMSAQGLAALRASEGQVNGGGYYNDEAGNCTRGTGTLVHHGACSAAELARPVDQQANERDFQDRVSDAEAQVRRDVHNRPLNQSQFDALVSATYNLGGRGAAQVLDRANHNDDAGVARELRRDVMEHHTDAHGHRIEAPSRGLERRREREAAPFEAPAH